MRNLHILMLLKKLIMTERSFFWKYCVFVGIFLILHLITPSGKAGLLLVTTVPGLALMPFLASVVAYLSMLGPAVYAISHKTGKSRIPFFCASGTLLLCLAFVSPLVVRNGITTAKSKLESSVVIAKPEGDFRTAELIGFGNEMRCQSLCRSLLIDKQYDWVRVTLPSWRNPRARIATFGLKMGDACLDPNSGPCIQIQRDTEIPAQLVAELRTIRDQDKDPLARSVARFRNAEVFEIRNQSGETLARQFGLIADVPKVPAVLIKDLFSKASFDPAPILLADEVTLATIDAPATFAKLGLVPDAVAQKPEQEINNDGHLVVRRGATTTSSNVLPPDAARSQYISSLLEDQEKPLTINEIVEYRAWLSLMNNATDLPPHMIDLVSRTISDKRLRKDTIWLLAKPMAASDDLARRILPQALYQIELNTEDAKYFARLIAASVNEGVKSNVLLANADAFFRVLESSGPELRQVLLPVAERFGRDPSASD